MIAPYGPPSTGRNPQNSYVTTAFLIIGAMAGGGVLGIPAGLLATGWVGIPLLFACCVIANITAQLLGGVLRRMPQDTIRDYGSLGGAAFGKAGVIATHVTQYVTLSGVSIIFLVLAGLLLNGIVPTVPARFFTMCVGIYMMVFLFIFPQMKEVSWISVLAVIATMAAVIFAVILSLIFFFGDDFPNCVTDPTNSVCVHPVFSAKFATGFGVFSFAFGGHSLIPNFYREMKHPKHWFRATQLAYWPVLLLMYLPMGVVGFYVYGETTEGNILGSIGKMDASTAIATNIIEGIVILHLLTAIPIIMTPVLERLERTFIKTKRYRKTRSLPKLIVRILGVAGLTTIAILLPYFLNLIALVNAFSVTCDVFIFPCLFYLKLRSTNVAQKIGIILIICFGIAGSVTSLIDAIPELIQAIRCGGNPFNNIMCFGNSTHCPSYCPPLAMAEYCNNFCANQTAHAINQTIRAFL